MKIRVDIVPLPSGEDYPKVVYYGFTGNITGKVYTEEKDMVDPIAPGGPDPGLNPAQPEKPPLRHPGFYKGDDAVEWAKNKIALMKYNSATIRGTPKLSPVHEQMLAENDRELNMMMALAMKAGIL